MKIIFLNLGILVVALLIGLKHHKGINELRSTNSQLESKTEAVSELKIEIAELETLNVDTNLLEDYRGETEELMRLRAEAARLRPLANQPKPELEAQVKQSENDLEKAQKSLENETKWIIDYANSSLRNDTSMLISHLTNGYIIQHLQFPDSLEPFRQIFSEFNNMFEEAKQSGEINAGFENTNIESFQLEDYEFNPPPGDMSEWQSDTIVFKERVPLELLNGGWERNYGILETNPRIHNDRPLPFHIITETVKLEDGDFEKWEREFAEKNSGN